MQAGLITQIKSGDRIAFDMLCRERYASLISFARLFLSGVNQTWAEDVVQDVLFGVWQNRRRLREDESELQAYLLRAVYNRFDNLSNKEISERLGISLSTVENHMYIALRQLRASLSGV